MATGFTPGDSGPGFVVDGDGRVQLSRLLTADEGKAAFVGSGAGEDLAGMWDFTEAGLGATHEAGNKLPSLVHKYEHSLRLEGVSDARLLEWAQACVTAYEEAGLPEYARGLRDTKSVWFAPIHDVWATAGGLAAFCVQEALRLGDWNLVTGIYGVDPDCLVDHMIEFMPMRAQQQLHHRTYTEMGVHRLDYWWGGHCAIRVSHPLGNDIVIGPIGTTENYTEELYDNMRHELTKQFVPGYKGTCGSTGIGIQGPLRNGAPNVGEFIISTLYAINSGWSCWKPGTMPWTTEHLDSLGVHWKPRGGQHPPGTVEVSMRFLPAPHTADQRISPPVIAYRALTERR